MKFWIVFKPSRVSCTFPALFIIKQILNLSILPLLKYTKQIDQLKSQNTILRNYRHQNRTKNYLSPDDIIFPNYSHLNHCIVDKNAHQQPKLSDKTFFEFCLLICTKTTPIRKLETKFQTFAFPTTLEISKISHIAPKHVYPSDIQRGEHFSQSFLSQTKNINILQTISK